ncbi:MAG: beta-galactosidase [Acidobacteriota bacterium]|nr:beta-galactosidase [Acidobacteriota bacterium]
MKHESKSRIGRREMMALGVSALGSAAFAGTWAAPAQNRPGRGRSHTFGWRGEHFLLDGEPFQIRSGSMHYPRVPRAYWRDRMRKMKAMGLNTLCTYTFWNLHEPRPGNFNFSGNLDVAAYLRIAQEEGLWAIIRPGPYICTEWDFGGLPAWLLAIPGMEVRSANAHFLEAASRYIKHVGQELAPLQISRGGPIIMAQVENEYGSYGNDKTYLRAIRDMIRAAGFSVTLYTSDGPGAKQLEGGTLPDLLSVINFGGGDAARQFASFAKFRRHVPRMCGEYWIGWFDHWGEEHHVTPPAESAAGLDWMLSQGISVNLYMFHGGTSFGFMSGANYGKSYEPDVTSYDYDAPLDEAGRPAKKFYVLRDVIRKYSPPSERFPQLPSPLPAIEIPRFEMKESAPLFAYLGQPHRSPAPKPMESFGQSYGFILYRTAIEHALRGSLEVIKLRDYASVLQGQKSLGVLDRRLKQDSLSVDLAAGEPLDILVENMGRINFGPRLPENHQGITQKVLLNGKELTGWSIYPLPLDPLPSLRFLSSPARGPAFYRHRFTVARAGDTFLDMRGWGMGCAWINGHNLGRYWKIGPQQTLFTPGCWLKRGINEIVVLDVEEGGHRSVAGLKDPLYMKRRL